MEKHLGNAYHVINLFEHISCILDAFHIIEIDQNNIQLDAFQVFVEEVSNLEYLAFIEVFHVINQKMYFLKVCCLGILVVYKIMLLKCIFVKYHSDSS